MCTVVQKRKEEGRKKNKYIYVFKIHHTSSTHLHKHARVSFTVSFGCQSAENKQQNENQELLLLRFYDNVLQHFPVFVFNVLNYLYGWSSKECKAHTCKALCPLTYYYTEGSQFPSLPPLPGVDELHEMNITDLDFLNCELRQQQRLQSRHRCLNLYCFYFGSTLSD